MIIDEKFIMLPPSPTSLNVARPITPNGSSYASPQLNPQNLSPGRPSQPKLTLTKLPLHILLQIMTHTFPSSTPAPAFELLLRHPHREVATNPDTVPELARKTLYWLSTSLRLVSRQMYIATMFVLRSTYLDSYHRMVRPGYSCDPFPVEGSGVGDALPTYSRNSSSTLTLSNNGSSQQIDSLPSFSASSAAPLLSTSAPPPLTSLTQPLCSHRETAILDRFIALKVRQDMFMDESELLMDREDAFRDLFEIAQPRARLEDLVRIIGSREGVVMGLGNDNGIPGSPMSVTSKRASLQPPPSPTSPAYSVPPPNYASTPGAGPSSGSRYDAQQRSSPTPPPKKERRSFFASLGFRSSSSSSPPSPSSRTPPPPSPPPPPRSIEPLPFSSLTVSFSPRTVGLVMNRHRTVVQVSRTNLSSNTREGRLEALATALVSGLKDVLAGED
ncbi:hypothetical protein CVT24_002500 [Panaeolus cyanescens]|uniref:Uncharacterized protein n=1 Tax=Panaeolus cyanescens TaxID=181874 RepID=A0A409WBR5_9AGAR|nr:hypothetical protein CVT24_002500 [Panaeolus cyanescens]